MGSAHDPRRMVAMALVLGGIVTIVVGVLAGALIEPFLYAIAAFALLDFALAWAYSTGRLGYSADRDEAAQAPGDITAQAEADPSFNPYARED